MALLRKWQSHFEEKSMRLEKLRNLMMEQGMDYYVVPTDDFHSSEYVGEYFQTRAWLSGFTGSAGTLLVGREFAGLWTDGRYFLQAGRQLEGSGIMLMKMGEENVPAIDDYLAEHLTDGMTLGFDGRCVSAGFAERLQEKLNGKKIRISYEKDLADEIWTDRPALSKQPAWFLSDEGCGASRAEKIALMREKMAEKGAESLLLTSLDDIAWLFNMRGGDVAYNPVVLSFCVITDSEIRLFIQKGALSKEQEKMLAGEGITLDDYLNVYEYVKHLTAKTILLNDQKTSYTLMENLPEGIGLIKDLTPASYAKAVKNAKEQENMRAAHVRDGVAVTKFMYWLKKNVGKIPMTEISIADHLRSLRAAMPRFLDESFNPIAGYADHGAIIHYSATEESCAEILPKGLLLLDTGAQYEDGTTDITRTFALGEISEQAKKHFTMVLKANLRLGGAKFRQGCTGPNLDILSKGVFWEEGLDYNHGTGHGVGYVLNVHETPNSIRWQVKNSYGEQLPFEEGMITSNEPGFYVEGQYGVRLENLILCKKAEKTEYGQFMEFETLTLVPFDLDAVDAEMLEKRDKQLLNDYHRRVYETISPYLTEEEKGWLADATRAV